MKVEIPQLSRLAKRLVDEGFVLKGTSYEVDAEAYSESFAHWRVILPNEALAHEEAVIYALTHPSHAHIKRESDCCDDDAAEFRVLTKWMKILAALIGLLIIATLAAPHLHAQGKDSQVFTIKFKEAGTAKATFAGPYTIDFTSGCTLTKSGSTIQVTCSGGGTTVAKTGFYLTISGTNYIPQNMFAATLPSAATYAWTNQASATETATNSALVLTDPASDGNNWKIRTASIGGNSTLITAQICHLNYSSGTFPGCGIGLRESATGKIVLISFTQVGGLIALVVQNWDSATAFGGTIVSEFLITPPTVIYFKTTYNGTNVTFHWSADGVTFKQFLTETKTTHFTTAPDQFFYGINGGNDGFANSITLLSWGVS